MQSSLNLFFGRDSKNCFPLARAIATFSFTATLTRVIDSPTHSHTLRNFACISRGNHRLTVCPNDSRNPMKPRVHNNHTFVNRDILTRLVSNLQSKLTCVWNAPAVPDQAEHGILLNFFVIGTLRLSLQVKPKSNANKHHRPYSATKCNENFIN